MATARLGYFLKDGKTKVPSVTTVLARFKESGGLIHWAWQQGKDGKDYREMRDAAASAGTMAHEAVEAWIKKQQFVFQDDDIGKRARKAFGAFLDWAEQTQLEVVETEKPLVSEKYKFGGTLDAMFVRGKLALGDWKTSNAIYAEYLVQVAAYGILWEENFPDKKIEGGFHLLRFDKDYGDFHHHWWGELETAKRSFVLMRELYENDKELKKRAA